MTKALYIETTAQLAAFIKKVETADFIAIDTEFKRETTYWPELCLIQIATPFAAAIIDPLASDIQLDAFFDLLIKPDIVKVFHAARQDIEIFYHLKEIIPYPLCDTQIAIMALDDIESIAYDKLVERLLHKKLDKSVRCSNWQKRPLTDQQKAYALADVTYLCDLYKLISRKLKAKGRENWYKHKIKPLLQKETYDIDPKLAWKKVKTPLNKAKELAILQKLAAWREEQAKSKNIARSLIMADNIMTAIASAHPQSLADFYRIRPEPKQIDTPCALTLLELINNDSQNPIAPLKMKNGRLSPNESWMLDLTKLLLKITAQKAKIAPSLIATSQELEELVKLKEKSALYKEKDWRFSLFSEKAVAFLSGKAILHINNQELSLSESKSPQ